MKNKFLAVNSNGTPADLTLLIIRIVFGYAFIIHGWSKILNPFHWMGADAQVPAFFQALAALSEFGGGIALILGLLTRLSSLGLFFTMIVAVYSHIFIYGNAFISKEDASYELPVIYVLLSLLFIVIGPGKFSLDKKIFGHK
ncbi:DoxX family protein [Silvanigrella sp.]|jgi:putative oxidoreductase|uniref:DoxX family protein n=1 Tax=Silvanigrella sp. TaxID=2024976 RepID=UPI0037C5D048|nr:DoxX family protein [Silvanigrellaceae bacterium]